MPITSNSEPRTPNPELPHYASQKRCVATGEIMRSAFFQINNLHRTHRATPNPRKIGLPACLPVRSLTVAVPKGAAGFHGTYRTARVSKRLPSRVRSNRSGDLFYEIMQFGGPDPYIAEERALRRGAHGRRRVGRERCAYVPRQQRPVEAVSRRRPRHARSIRSRSEAGVGMVRLASLPDREGEAECRTFRAGGAGADGPQLYFDHAECRRPAR